MTNNFFSIYNSEESFKNDYQLLIPHIDRVIGSIKSVDLPVDFCELFTRCIHVTEEILKSHTSFVSFKDKQEENEITETTSTDVTFTKLLFKSCINSSLTTFYTLLKGNCKVSASKSFADYYFLHQPIFIPLSNAKLRQIKEKGNYTFDAKTKNLVSPSFRQTKKRSFSAVESHYPSLFATINHKQLFVPTLNTCLYLASEFTDKRHGLSKIHDLIQQIAPLLTKYDRTQKNLDNTYTQVLRTREFLTQNIPSQFYRNIAQEHLGKKLDSFYRIVSDKCTPQIIIWENQETTRANIIQHLFLYDKELFESALTLLKINQSHMQLAREIYNIYHPKLVELDRFISKINTPLDDNLPDINSYLSFVLERHPALSTQTEIAEMQRSVKILQSLIKERHDITRAIDSLVMPLLTEYYCSYHSNASINRFRHIQESTSQLNIDELCDYIQNLQLQNIVFRPDYVDAHLFCEPFFFRTTEKDLESYYKELSIPFCQRHLFTSVYNIARYKAKYDNESETLTLDGVLDYFFNAFYPTLTRLFLFSLFNLVKDEKIPYRSCCEMIKDSYSKALHKYNTRITPPKDLYPHIKTKTDFSETDSFIEPDSDFIRYLDKIFSVKCNNYISPSGIYLVPVEPKDDIYTLSSDTNPNTRWKEIIRNQSTTIPEIFYPAFESAEKNAPFSLASEAWIISLAKTVSSVFTFSVPQEHVAELPQKFFQKKSD